MSGWTAIVPMKPAGTRKSRLSGQLAAIDRELLSVALFAHVIATLQASPEIARIIVVSGRSPGIADVDWLEDKGGGLNAELARALPPTGPVLIIHADLPLVAPADIAGLVAAADDGIAIAPDSHGTGTNALAFGGAARIVLRFGADSFALHQAQCPAAAVVRGGPGLALDVDTPADFDAAVRAGWVPPAF